MAVRAGTYRGVSATDRSAARRQRLLEAALEVGGRNDGVAITMTRVCAEAGLTERYFYQHFSGLDEALMTVLDGISEEIVARTLAALDAPGDPVERVRAAITAFVKILTDDPRKGRLAIVESGAREALLPRRNELLLWFATFAASEARELYGERALTGREGELSGLLFVGGLLELLRAWICDEITASPQDLVEAVTRQFALTAQR